MKGAHPHRDPFLRGTLVLFLFTAAVALTSSPTVAAFNDNGQVQSEFATAQAEPLGFIGVDAGDAYSVGWTEKGEVFTWGSNSRGQLGIGEEGGARSLPEQVMLPPGEQVIRAAAGIDTVIAVTANGGVYTWGNPDVSQNTPTPARNTFFDSLGDPVVGVASGGYYFLAWTESGALYSWGESGGGRLGRPSAPGQSPPSRVTAQGLDVRHVDGAAAGRFQGLAWADGGTVTIAWGAGYGGAAGTPISGVPTSITGADAGTGILLLWTPDGRLYSATSSTASQVAALSSIVGASASSPSAGASSLYAWTADGTLYSWGSNTQGQLGLGSTGGSVPNPTAVALAGGSAARQVGAGADHALYISNDGIYSSAGSNDSGQLGTGNTTPRNTFGSAVPILRWP